MAIQLLTVALGSYLSSALVAIMGAITGTPGWLPPAGYTVNQGHMDYCTFAWFLLVVSLFLSSFFPSFSPSISRTLRVV